MHSGVEGARRGGGAGWSAAALQQQQRRRRRWRRSPRRCRDGSAREGGTHQEEALKSPSGFSRHGDEGAAGLPPGAHGNDAVVRVIVDVVVKENGMLAAGLATGAVGRRLKWGRPPLNKWVGHRCLLVCSRPHAKARHQPAASPVKVGKAQPQGLPEGGPVTARA